MSSMLNLRLGAKNPLLTLGPDAEIGVGEQVHQQADEQKDHQDQEHEENEKPVLSKKPSPLSARL